MKRTITYREITVAIGILVAMVIALTLWMKTPREKITESGSQKPMNIEIVGFRTQFLQSIGDLSADFYRLDARFAK